MVKYDFSDDQITDIIAFLKWIGEIDTNGFPREPDLAQPTPGVANAATRAGPPAPQIFHDICQACHSLGGEGGHVGPALDGVGGRFESGALRTWLADPASVKPGTTMPKLPLSDQQLTDLTSFLSAQR